MDAFDPQELLDGWGEAQSPDDWDFTQRWVLMIAARGFNGKDAEVPQGHLMVESLRMGRRLDRMSLAPRLGFIVPEGEDEEWRIPV